MSQPFYENYKMTVQYQPAVNINPYPYQLQGVLPPTSYPEYIPPAPMNTEPLYVYNNKVTNNSIPEYNPPEPMNTEPLYVYNNKVTNNSIPEYIPPEPMDPEPLYVDNTKATKNSIPKHNNQLLNNVNRVPLYSGKFTNNYCFDKIFLSYLILSLFYIPLNIVINYIYLS